MELFGPDILSDIPVLYWEVSTAQRLGKDFMEWRKMPPRIRALEIAVHQQQQMLEVMDKHKRIQYNRKKDLHKNDASTSQTSGAFAPPPAK